MAEPTIYTTGGTVQAGGGIYLSRRADADLLALCQEGAFAYILTPRQMGKSSLMVQTAERLSQEGIQSAIIDLTQLGVQVTAEQWYLGLLTIIEDQLDLNTNVVRWWQERTHLGLSQRMTHFFREVLLLEVAEPIVIFVDEIDSTLTLDFTDDFFAVIRYLYVARAQEPEFQRLSFVLIGVATPGDLIRDPKRTPFNVGQRVDLTDFALAEAMPLAAGLGLLEPQAEQVMGWVLKWTGGHPYLTQRLCGAMVESQSASGSRQYREADVDQVVNRTFLGAMSEQDNNLQFVRDMLTKRAPEPEVVLRTYREIRRGSQSVVDEEQSLVKSHLKLSGVLRREGKHLVVRNLIYATVFNAQWIREHLPETFWQRYQPVLKWAVPLTVASIAVAVAMTKLAAEAQYQANKAQQQKVIADQNANKAQQQKVIADQNANDALTSKKKAQQALENEKQANQQRTIALTTAETQRQRAEDQAQIAQTQRQRAEAQTTLAQAQTHRAETQTEIAQAQTDIAKQAETQAKDSAEKNRLDALNTKAIADSLYWQRLMDDEMFNLEEQIVALEKVIAWQGKLTDLREDTRLELLATLDRAAHIPREKIRLKGHQKEVTVVVVSPDGKSILTGSRDKTAKLWSHNGQLLHTFSQQDQVTSVAFSKDSKYILISDSSTVKLWSTSRKLRPMGQLLKTFQKVDMTNAVFSPNGKNVLLAGGNSAELWSIDGEMLKTFQKVGITNAVFSPDGKSVLLAGGNSAELWSIDRQLLKTFQKGGITSAVFSPNGENILITGGNSAELWSIDRQLLQNFRSDGVGVNSAAFSPDGKTVLISTGSWAELWSINGYLLHKFKGIQDTVVYSAFLPDGKSILYTSGNIAELWSIDRPHRQNFQSDISGISAFSRDGKNILIVDGDSTVKLWSINGQLLRTFPDVGVSLAFSPDGKALLIGGKNSAKLWSIDGKLQQTFKGDVTNVAFSSNGRNILIVGADSTVKLWSIDGHLLSTSHLQTRSLTNVAFSPDGKLVLGSDGEIMKLWSVDGHLRQTFQGHQGQINGIAFSPNGKTVVSGSAVDNILKLWSIDGKLLQTFQGHQWFVSKVTFSPNGQTILSGSADGTAKLWSLDGRLLNTFQDLEGKPYSLPIIYSVAFSPNGKSILVGNEARQSVLLNLDLNFSLALMCDHLHDFATDSSNLNLFEDNRKLQERTLRVCKGIPQPQSIQISNSTGGNPEKSSWWQDIISASFQAIFHRF